MDLILSYLALVVLALGSFYFFWSKYMKTNRLVTLIEKIPGPSTLPLFGNTLEFKLDASDYFPTFARHTKKYPRIYRLWLGTTPFVFLTHPDNIAPILKCTVNIDKPDIYRLLEPGLGNGLSVSNGDKWKVLNISKEAAMGCNVNAQEGEPALIKAIIKEREIILKRALLPWFDALFNLTPAGRDHRKCIMTSHKFTDDVIQRKKEEWKVKYPNGFNSNDLKGEKKRLAFLDLILAMTDGGRLLDDIGLREEVDSFVIVGHDTAASSMSWAMYLLGCYPEIQKKVHEELDFIFGDDTERPVTFEDMGRLKYLDQVIKEQCRLFPAVPYVLRKVTEEMVIDGYTIPSGTVLGPSMIFSQRDPEIYDNPMEFDPDRFLPENCVGRHPYAFTTFSAGPRNCIGQKFALMEMKVVLAQVLRKFNIRSTVPWQDVKILMNVTITSVTGLHVVLTHRNKTNGVIE